MPAQRFAPKASWLFSVMLVTALHLLTTVGAWWITDHGEILAVADGFSPPAAWTFQISGKRDSCPFPSSF